MADSINSVCKENFVLTGSATAPVRWCLRQLSADRATPAADSAPASGNPDQVLPALALHGFTGSGADFQWLASATADLCRWQALDFLGHGHSDTPTSPHAYSPAPAARAINAALEHTASSASADSGCLRQPRSEEKSLLLGYSMGGRMALRYLARYGTGHVRALILIGASAGLAGETARRERRQADHTLARKIESEGIPAFMHYWNRLPIISSQQRSPYFEVLQQRRSHNSTQGLANSLRGIGTGAVAPVTHCLSRIDIPCLLLTGEDDHKFTEIAQSMAQQLPQARHVIIENSGHSPHWENPVTCTAAIRQWLLREVL